MPRPYMVVIQPGRRGIGSPVGTGPDRLTFCPRGARTVRRLVTQRGVAALCSFCRMPPMSEDPRSGHGPQLPGRSAVLGWLGLFLAVFAVASLALSLAGFFAKEAEIPSVVTQEAR
jgi:hypothetical protein